jgi:hypothetical protein
MLGLCLVAVCAIVAAAATSASALPEWGKCEAKAGGKYLDSNCTKKGTLKNPGSFEFKKGTEVGNVKFTGEGGAGILTVDGRICKGNAGGGGIEVSEGSERTKKCEEGGVIEPGTNSVECTSENATGEQFGTKEVKNVNVTFHGCSAAGVLPCQNTATEGEIKTHTLKGALGYISKSKKEVGVSLTPVKAKAHFADFECAKAILSSVGVGNPITEGCAYKETTKCGGDGIISPITPVNEMTSTFTQVYTANAAFENIPSKFEGKPRESLEAFLAIAERPANSTLWSKSTEVITNVNTPAEPGEIKA